MDPDEVARRSAEAMWAGDLASQSLGMTVDEGGPGRPPRRIPRRRDRANAHARAQGGFPGAGPDSAFAFACNSRNRRTVAAGAEVRFRAPTRLGDTLVARAVERSRDDRGGTYDVTVTVGETVVATFVGHAREIGGLLFEE